MDECNLHTIVRLPNSVFRPYASTRTTLSVEQRVGSSSNEVRCIQKASSAC